MALSLAEKHYELANEAPWLTGNVLRQVSKVQHCARKHRQPRSKGRSQTPGLSSQLTRCNSLRIFFPLFVKPNRPRQNAMKRPRHGQGVPHDHERGRQELDPEGLVRRAQSRKQVAVEDVVDSFRDETKCQAFVTMLGYSSEDWQSRLTRSSSTAQKQLSANRSATSGFSCKPLTLNTNTNARLRTFVCKTQLLAALRMLQVAIQVQT